MAKEQLSRKKHMDQRLTRTFKEFSGRNLLQEIVRRDDTGFLRDKLATLSPDERNKVLNRQYANQTTILHYAAKLKCSVATLELLVTQDNLNAIDRDRDSALHSAACHGTPEIVQFLLARGANEDLLNGLGRTALHKAVINGRKDNAELLLKPENITRFDTSGLTPVHEAVNTHKLDLLQLLIQHCGNIDILDRDRDTPLHFAARTNFVAGINFLCANGANKELYNRASQTPLFCAVWSYHLEAVQALINNRVNLNAQDYHGITPLMTAATKHRPGHFRSLEIISILLEAGADPTMIANNGNSIKDCLPTVDNMRTEETPIFLPALERFEAFHGLACTK